MNEITRVGVVSSERRRTDVGCPRPRRNATGVSQFISQLRDHARSRMIPSVLVVRVVLTIAHDLQSAKAATVVGGGVEGAVDRSTRCPYAASVSQLMSHRRDQGRAHAVASVLVVRAILTIAQDLRAGKAAAVIGGDVGRAVAKSTRCPYAAVVVASFTKATRGSASF